MGLLPADRDFGAIAFLALDGCLDAEVFSFAAGLIVVLRGKADGLRALAALPAGSRTLFLAVVDLPTFFLLAGTFFLATTIFFVAFFATGFFATDFLATAFFRAGAAFFGAALRAVDFVRDDGFFFAADLIVLLPAFLFAADFFPDGFFVAAFLVALVLFVLVVAMLSPGMFAQRYRQCVTVDQQTRLQFQDCVGTSHAIVRLDMR